MMYSVLIGIVVGLTLACRSLRRENARLRSELSAQCRVVELIEVDRRAYRNVADANGFNAATGTLIAAQFKTVN